MTAPVVALLGRPNVGKSTLFNQLTRSRDALVADEPGLTRDRRYGIARVGERQVVLVDTGGIVDEAEGMEDAIVRQSLLALEEAALALFVVDARSGLTAADAPVVDALRARNRPTLIVVNKSEGLDAATAAAEFYALGFAGPVCVAAAHRQGLEKLRGAILEHLPPTLQETPDVAPEGSAEDAIRVAIVGRPNAGKSTLFNRLLREERAIASDVPGTTRDSIEVPLEWEGRHYRLIDTAGLRRRGRIHERVEKFSAIKTLQAVESAHVVITLLDARAEVAAQDARILAEVAAAGKALVLGLNKWDGLSAEARGRFESEVERKLSFCQYAAVQRMSGLHGSGLGELMAKVARAAEVAFVDLPTPALTRVLEELVRRHAPPSQGGRRPKLRYAHQGGKNPPRIVIHGSGTARVADNYQRYLNNGFREAFDLWGTPIELEFRASDNPYKDKPNPLSERQYRKRQRIIRHDRRKR